MNRHNLPLNPNSSNNRVPAIAKARDMAAHIIPPKILLDLWPRAKTVREIYAAVAACHEAGLKQPTYFELSAISGRSSPSVASAIRNLEAAGLIVRTQVDSMNSGIRYDYMIPPLSEACE